MLLLIRVLEAEFRGWKEVSETILHAPRHEYPGPNHELPTEPWYRSLDVCLKASLVKAGGEIVER